MRCRIRGPQDRGTIGQVTSRLDDDVALDAASRVDAPETQRQAVRLLEPTLRPGTESYSRRVW